MELPKCELCSHFRGYRQKTIICDAFLEGQPKSFNPWGDEDEKCRNGIKYDGSISKNEPPKGGLLGKMKLCGH